MYGKRSGFALKFIQVILFLVVTGILYVAFTFIIKQAGSGDSSDVKMLGELRRVICGVMIAWTVVYFIFACLGRRRSWPNVITLLMSIPFLLGGVFMGLFGLLGSIFGLRGPRVSYTAPYNGGATARPQSGSAHVSPEDPFADLNSNYASSSASAAAKDPPADPFLFDQKSAALKDKILDKNIKLPVTFKNASGKSITFNRIDSIYSDADGGIKLYAILELEGGTPDDVFIAVYNEEKDELNVVPKYISEKVFSEWQVRSIGAG